MDIKTISRKITSMTLSLLMVIGMVPICAFADEVECDSLSVNPIQEITPSDAVSTGSDKWLSPESVKEESEKNTPDLDDPSEETNSVENVNEEFLSSSGDNFLALSSGSCGDGTYWSINNNGELRIYGNGAFSPEYNAGEAPWIADLPQNGMEVLSIVLENGITEIGEYAFEAFPNCTNLTIGPSVATIDDNALATVMLQSLSVSTDNPYYESYNNSLYSKGREILIRCNTLESGTFTIPNTVTEINDMAFNYCDALLKLVIPASVSNVGRLMLYNGIEEIEVASDNENYCSENGILFNKEKTSIIRYPGRKDGDTYTIPSSVKTIASGAFGAAIFLENITLPAGLERIDTLAFVLCWSLKSIVIPQTVQHLDNELFWSCSDLDSIQVDSNNAYYTSENGVLYNKAKTELLEVPSAKRGSIIIPGTVSTIGSGAFYSSNLDSIVIPTSVSSIGEDAFYNCSGTSIFYAGTESQWNAIDNLSSSDLEYFDISIQFNTDITAYNSITVDSSLKKYISVNHSLALTGDTVTVSAVGKPGEVEAIPIIRKVYVDGNPIEGISFEVQGNHVITADIETHEYDYWWWAGEEAYWALSADGELMITGIGDTWNNAKGDTWTWKYDIPSIPVKSVIIATGITSLGSNLFNNEKNIETLTLPSTVTRIGNTCFTNCTGLTEIFYDGEAANWNSIENLANSGLPISGNDRCHIHTGGKCTKDYQTVTGTTIPATHNTTGLTAEITCATCGAVIESAKTIGKLPGATAVNIFKENENVTNKTIYYVIGQPLTLVLDATIIPLNAERNVSWTMVDNQNTGIEYEQSGNRLSVSLCEWTPPLMSPSPFAMSNPAENDSTSVEEGNSPTNTIDFDEVSQATGMLKSGNEEIRPGTVVFTATAMDGTGKSAKVTLIIEEPADLERIIYANELLNDTAESKDGRDVAEGYYWAPSKAVTNFKNAIYTANNQVTAAGATNTQQLSAIATLNNAIATFENTRKTGDAWPTISLSLPESEIEVGIKCKYILVPEQSSFVVDQFQTATPVARGQEGLIWASSDPKIAMVDANGVVTGVSAGECTITVTTKSTRKTASCTVAVVQPITGIKLAKSSVLVAKNGEGETVSFSITDKTGLAKTNFVLSYDTDYLAVSLIPEDNAIEVTPLDKTIKSTTVILTDTVSGKTAKLTVQIGEPANLVTTSLKSTSVGIIIGKTTSLNATAAVNDGTGKASKTKPISTAVTWVSLNESIATVDAKGKVTAVGIGHCVIRAIPVYPEDCSVYLEFEISVTPVLQSFTLYDANGGKITSAFAEAGTSLCIGNYITSASVIFQNADPSYADYTISYSMPNTSFSTLDPESGILELTGTGTSKITVTVTCGNQKKTATLNVSSGSYANLVTTSLKTTEVGLLAGKGTSLNATAVLNDGTGKASKTKPVNAAVIWESLDETVATVDAKGKVTAVSVGECTIVASPASPAAGAQSLEFHIIVTPVLNSFALLDGNGAKISAFCVETGKAADLSELITDESIVFTGADDSYSNYDITYTMPRNAAATLDANTGLLTTTAAAKLKVTVKITCGTQSKSATLNVTVGPFADIITTSLKSTSSDVIKGKTITLNATAGLDDGTGKAQKTKPVSTAVVWSTENPAVATVDVKGKVTGVGVGSCEITVVPQYPTSDTVKMTFIVTVSPTLNAVTLYDSLGNKVSTVNAYVGDTIDVSRYLLVNSIAWKDAPAMFSDYTVTYSTTAKSNVATVDSTTGEVNCIGKGKAAIKVNVQCGAQIKSATININITPP